MSVAQQTEDFLARGPWAVIGASTDRDKYGNKVLRCYLQHDKRPVFPINPGASEVEGEPAYPDLRSLPQTPRAISIITPPAVTASIVRQALELQIEHFWMQPGAEEPGAIQLANEAGANVIAGGPCLLVVLGYRES